MIVTKWMSGAVALLLLASMACSLREEIPLPIAQEAENLVDARENPADAGRFDKPYILVYFSAHWCPPCRKFTPVLVRYYRDAGEDRPFEVLFVSSDRREEDMFNYMEKMKMPWPAARFRSSLAKTLNDRYCGPGIPCLVLVTPEGKILADSYDGSEYLGPVQVLDELDRILEKG